MFKFRYIVRSFKSNIIKPILIIIIQYFGYCFNCFRREYVSVISKIKYNRSTTQWYHNGVHPGYYPKKKFGADIQTNKTPKDVQFLTSFWSINGVCCALSFLEPLGRNRCFSLLKLCWTTFFFSLRVPTLSV